MTPEQQRQYQLFIGMVNSLEEACINEAVVGTKHPKTSHPAVREAHEKVAGLREAITDLFVAVLTNDQNGS